MQGSLLHVCFAIYPYHNSGVMLYHIYTRGKDIACSFCYCTVDDKAILYYFVLALYFFCENVPHSQGLWITVVGVLLWLLFSNKKASSVRCTSVMGRDKWIMRDIKGPRLERAGPSRDPSFSVEASRGNKSSLGHSSQGTGGRDRGSSQETQEGHAWLRF